MTDPDDNPLAGVDLHRWRVPPPPAGQHAAILGRALAPAATPRRRIGWTIPVAMLASAVVAAVIALVVARPAPAPPTEQVAARPAGGASSELRELLLRLERQELQIEMQLNELRQLRELADRLGEKIAKLEGRETVERRDRPAPRVPTKTPTPTPDPSCDEVSCVLTNYEGACCAKYQTPGALDLATKPPARVTVDGREIGTTPVRALRLSRGRHNVTLELPTMRHTFVVTIESGKTTKVIKDFSGSVP